MAFSFALVSGAPALTSGTPAFRPDKAKVHTVRNDRGGYLLKYALRVKRFEQGGTHVRFAGRCDSACTLYLTLPKSRSCITRGASFGFHLPYGSSSRGNHLAAEFMMKQYPSWVRSWVRSNGGLKNRTKTMSYAYASQFIPTCPETRKTPRMVKAKIWNARYGGR